MGRGSGWEEVPDLRHPNSRRGQHHGRVYGLWERCGEGSSSPLAAACWGPANACAPSCALRVLVWDELELGVGRPRSRSLGDVAVTLCGVSPFGSTVSLAAPGTGLGSAGSVEGLERDTGLTPGLRCLEGAPWGCHGPAEPTPPWGPLAPGGRLGPSHSAKGETSPGRLPETALLGHGVIKGRNRLTPPHAYGGVLGTGGVMWMLGTGGLTA